MQAKLIISFETLSEPDYFTRLEGINSAMATNSNFPGPWPGPLGSPSTLTGLFTGYQTAFNAALTNDEAKLALRDAARTALMVYAKKLAPYLEVIANGDVAKLLSTGYELRRDSAHNGGGEPLPAPSDFRMVRGEVGGSLIARARKLPGKTSYLVQTTEGDPTVEANWQDYAVVTSCRKIQIAGQTPGKVVSVRLRGINNIGPGAWTIPLSLMVV